MLETMCLMKSPAQQLRNRDSGGFINLTANCVDSIPVCGFHYKHSVLASQLREDEGSAPFVDTMSQ